MMGRPVVEMWLLSMAVVVLDHLDHGVFLDRQDRLDRRVLIQAMLQDRQDHEALNPQDILDHAAQEMQDPLDLLAQQAYRDLEVPQDPQEIRVLLGAPDQLALQA